MGLVTVGIFFIVTAVDAKAQIRTELAGEQVMTSADASIPGVPVTDAKTAQAQADVIKAHSHDRYGLYSTMSRDDDTNRQTYLNGMTLRNSLGLATLGLGAPVLYWLRVSESERVGRV